MESPQPHKTSTAFEYFLYAAIIAETGLAALIYKVILHSGELMHLRVYFAIFYFAFLAWTITQLNLVHRDRNSVPSAEQELEPAPAEIATAGKRPVLGLTGPQLVIVVVVFATAVLTFSWALRLIN
jgi:uncharacterized membrane protein